MLRLDAQPLRERDDEALGRRAVGGARGHVLGEQAGLAPDRLAVAAEVAGERPARQRLARVPLPLAVVEHAARREARAQPAQQPIGQPRACPARARRCSTRRASRSSIDTNVGSPPIVSRTSSRSRSRSTCRPERLDRRPLILAVRLGDARRLVDARDAHLEGELLADVIRRRPRPPTSTNREIGAAVAGSGRAGERDVPLPRQQAAGRRRARSSPRRAGRPRSRRADRRRPR